MAWRHPPYFREQGGAGKAILLSRVRVTQNQGNPLPCLPRQVKPSRRSRSSAPPSRRRRPDQAGAKSGSALHCALRAEAFVSTILYYEIQESAELASGQK